MKKIVLQDNQLNQLVGRVTEGLLSGASFPKGHVSGEEILTFAKHQQVNKFVLFQIYQDWSAHMQKMAHPYFNYNHPDVIKGLKIFQNIISDHIQVPVADFRKMLQQAVYNSLKLILNPADAIGNFFFKGTDAIPSEMYNKHAAYFKDFDFVILALQKFFEKNGHKRIDKKLYFEKFEKVIGIYETKNKLGELDYQRNLFKSLTGRDLEQFLQQAAIEKAKEAQNARIQAKPASPPPSREPVQKEPAKPVAEKPVVKTTTPESESAKEAEKQEPKSQVGKEAPSTNSEEAKPKTLSESFRNKGEEKPQSLNEQFSNKENAGKSVVDRKQEEKPKENAADAPKRKVPPLLKSTRREKTEASKEAAKPEGQAEGGKKSTIDLFAQKKKAESQLKEKRTLADTLSESSDGKTVNDQMGEAKTIRTDQIPVHKQFQFVQKVFGGSSVKFKVVLDKINKTESMEEAESVLERYVFNDPTVNRNDKVCQEFESLVRNRFSNWA